MKVHFLGTSAGTEPMPDRRHACVVVEAGDKLYWLDAGESCSVTGHTMGLDLLKIANIIISHPHPDHIGGLYNLIWTVWKLGQQQKRLPENNICVYTPSENVKSFVNAALCDCEGNFVSNFEVECRDVEEGVLLDDGIMKITAYRNEHMTGKIGKKWISYSYKLEADGKILVYSGDLRRYDELDCIISGGCDGLIIETGHFGIDDVRDYTADKNIGRIFFSHNGREIINFPEESQKKVESYFNGKAVICEDRMSFEL